MPWKIEAGDDGFYVVNIATGKRMNDKPHPTSKAAAEHRKALYANVSEVGKEAALPKVMEGAMVAFYPTQEVASLLAVPDGLPAEDLHLTLAFLGQAVDIDESVRAVVESALGELAMEQGYISGMVNGVGRFFAHAENNGKECIFAIIDSAGLFEFRHKVVEALIKAGLPPVSNHGFVPHMTLSYVDPGADVKAPPPLHVMFEDLWLVWGNEVISFPLREMPADQIERKEITARQDVTPADKKRSDEVSAVKAKIVASWKKKIAPEGPPAAQEKEVSSETTAVTAHGPGGTFSSFGLGLARGHKKKRKTVKEFILRVVLAIARAPKPAADQDISPGSVTVFKDADGKYRWLVISSNAFRDRDKEIVSTKALINDVDRSETSGGYGPLRWWHIKGADIGDCDYRAIFGRMLIESGTFRRDDIAERVKENAASLRLSLGFTHPANEPDADGVFHHITVFERSLVPIGRAANDHTRLTVKGD